MRHGSVVPRPGGRARLARRPRPAVAGARGLDGGRRAQPAPRRRASSTRSTAWSTSTATTSRRRRSSTTCATGAASAHTVDASLLDRSLARVFPDVDSDEQRAGLPPGRHPGHDRDHRRSGHRQDDRRRRSAGRAGRAGGGAAARRCASRSPRPRARPPPGCEQSVRDSADALRRGRPGPAGRRHRDDAAPAAAPAPRQQHPLPPPPRQPAPARPRRGRRGVDGVADDDGAPARGHPPRGAAGARGRPRPAQLGRRRCGAHRPGPRLRAPRRQPGRRPDDGTPLRRRDRTSSPRPSASATPTPRSRLCGPAARPSSG